MSFIPRLYVVGKMYLRGDDIYAMEPIHLRRKIGMVFQNRTRSMMSIYDT